MKEFLVYRSINWQKHFKVGVDFFFTFWVFEKSDFFKDIDPYRKAPLPYGVCIKMGHIQNFGQCKKGSPTERIKFISLENEFSELKVRFWSFSDVDY